MFYELMGSLNSWTILIDKICSAKCLNYKSCLPALTTIIYLPTHAFTSILIN